MAAAILLLLAACGEDSGQPYVEIVGGGFVFNYRVADTYYGIVAVARRPVPAGTELVAEFEDPAGGPPIRVSQIARDGQSRFVMDSRSVHGVAADRDYAVVLTLRAADGTVIETHSKTFRSSIDQSTMPDRPLTIGPGYTPNPELRTPAPEPRQ